MARLPDGTAAGNLRQRLFRLAKISGSRIVEGKDTLQLAEAVRHDLDVIAALAEGAEGRGLLEALDYPDGDELAERIALLRDQWLQRCSAALERQAQALETALDIKSYAMAVLKTGYCDSTKRNMPKAWFDKLPHTHVALDDAIEQGALFCNMLRHNLGPGHG